MNHVKLWVNNATDQETLADTSSNSMAATLHRSFFVSCRVWSQFKSHCRKLSVSYAASKHVPLTSDELPRPAGVASMFRLPIKQDSKGLTKVQSS